MKKYFLKTVLCHIMLTVFSTGIACGQIAYDPGDWVTYRDCRFAVSVDLGMNEMYAATSGGILSYHLLQKRWFDPTAAGYSLSVPVEIDDPVLLLMDIETGFLWVATQTQMLLYDVNADRWRSVVRNLWGPGDRVVNIGVGGDDIYIETLPRSIYERSVSPLSPIPSPDYLNWVTRFKGTRTFGGFMIDIENELPGNMHWRGLRAKRPLAKEDLYGVVGTPPLNFPLIVMPGGWGFSTDGTVLDPFLRSAVITDWIVDRFGTMWTTHWGAGLVATNMRSGRAEPFLFGPAGEDVSALMVTDDAVWMGGNNTGERRGISRASKKFDSWSYFETRSESRIRSTDVYDFAEADGYIWVATDDGLSAFQEREQRWSRFTVRDNLQSDHIRALLSLDGELWIGMTDGLCVIVLPDQQVWRISNPGIEAAGVTDLAAVGDTVYVATGFGWYKGHRTDRSFVPAKPAPDFIVGPVTEVSAVGAEIWAVTDAGVMSYNQNTGEYKSWLATVWLKDAVPTCIHAMNKFVWVGTEQKGFFRYDRETGEWLQYTTADGLIDNLVQVIRHRGDDLLIGTPRGLTKFYWNDPGRHR